MSKKNKEDKEDYHGVAPIGNVMKKMKKKFDKDPKDWRIIGSRDEHGNTDTFIEKNPSTFWLKSKQLSPYSALSMGSEIRNLDKDIDESVGKQLTREDMLRLFGMVVPIKPNQNVVAAGIEKYSQHHGNHLKKVIKENKPNLGYQLARKLDDEFVKKHPQRKNLYI